MSENFSGGSLVDWRIELQKKNILLADQLHEEADPYQTLIELGLPVPPYLAIESIVTFLEDPEQKLKVLKNQGIDQFYVGLRPISPDLPKYRELELEADQVAPYIQSVIPVEDYNNYHLRVAEYAPAEYGAVAIVNPSGALRVELARGEMSNLATGTKTPEFTVEANQFTGVLNHSFDDLELRKAIVAAINAMPSLEVQEASIRQNRKPGYYEFVLVRRGGKLRPTYFDYKSSPLFSLPE